MATPPLGWIEPSQRTVEQNRLHAAALAAAPKFALQPVVTAGPVKVMLTDFWKKPEVVSDLNGITFTGFRQLTGSCVGASEGNGIFTLGAVQRLLETNATQAFIPWWLFPYGRTRFNTGDRGQGEGAVVSIMGQTLIREGVFDCGQPGLPTFDVSDGYCLTKKIEFEWSDGGSPTVTRWLELGRRHPLGTQSPLYSPADVKTSILNGYPVLYGCGYYIGNGSIRGTGANAYVRGVYDGRGGHATCFLGYWDHPTDGPLYLYSNQWDGSTYPTDPAGAPRCCVWTPESEVSKVFRLFGGGDGETMALSHLNWFPAQADKILDFTQI